jgi:anti-anti-sigma regulatory factor
MSATHLTDRPSLTETVNIRTGAIRVTGHLTVQGADLLRGTVESLRRSGHTRVVLDLRGLEAADDAGVQVLVDVDRSLAEDGGRLLVQHSSGWPAAHSSSVR